MAATEFALDQKNYRADAPLGPNDIRQIIGAHAKIPGHVRDAMFTCVKERELTRQAYDEIVSQHCTDGLAEAWQARLRCRQRRLQPFIGRLLVCVFVHLPGVHFTIEIDPQRRRVVHFEGQSA